MRKNLKNAVQPMHNTPWYGALMMVWATVSICCFLSLDRYASAQIATADVVGAVTDPNGAVLAGAKVEIRNVGTDEVRKTITGGSGEYAFNLLQIGKYVVTVEAPTFKTFSTPSVELSAGQRARVDAKMEVGSASETVEVTETPPTLQTDSSDVGATVDAKQVEDLPLNGRNYINLVQSEPGVNPGPASSMSGGSRPDDRRQASSFSANGQPETQNAQYLDGLDNVDRQQGGLGVRPSIDAIAEVRVQTNMFTAESSRTAGAVVNVITKSGANTLHGSAYEFLRNDIFDARDYFARDGEVAKPKFRQNQFGGSLGGRIIKDKTFFFADVEDLRIVQGENPVTQTVPTLNEQQNPGDFTDVGGGKLTGPLDPIGLEYFQMFPKPTNSATSSNYVYGGVRSQKSLTGDVRIDHHFSPSDSFFARYSGNPVTTVTPGIMPSTTVNGITVDPGGASALNTSVSFPGTGQEDAQGFQLNYIHIFTPNLLLELKAGYTYIKIFSLPLNYGTNVSQKLGIPNVNTDAFSSGLTILSPAGYNQPGNTIFDGLGSGAFIPILNTNHTYQYHGAVTYTKGTHNFRFGAAVIRRHLDDLQELYAQGLFAFFGGPAGPNTVDSEGSPTNSLAQMLTGSPNFLLRGNSLFKPHYRFWEPSFYAQDDWRVKPWLTLNLGVRYEIFTQFTEEQNRLANFNLQTFSVEQATNGNPHPGINNDLRDVSPRIGFAATVAKGTVIRGGFGMSYTPGIQPGFNNIPYSSGFSCVPGNSVANGGCGSSYGTLAQGFPVPIAANPNDLSGTLTEHPADTRTPYVEMWNLIAQKDIGSNTISLGYIGQRGHRFTLDPNVDLPPPSTGAQNPLVYSSQLPAVTNITLRNFEGVSTYDAMMATFQRAYKSGFTFNANYTWAHGLSDFLAPGVTNNAARLLLPNNPMYDYGNTDTDIRHRVAILAAYELPFGKSATGLRGLTEKGWQINAVSSWQTGEALSVEDSTSFGSDRINIPTVTADRPNMVKNPNISNRSISHFFDYTAFQLPALGVPGTEHINQLYGPHYTHTDMSVFKTFPLKERLNLQFRAEFFDLFNQPFFNNPNTAINGYTEANGTPQTGDVANGSGALGVIGSTAPNSIPREIQFALRLSF
jgi:carboxypeptidase family protein/TonB-dependent receptor-like protein